jgi:hypothetical protein
MPRPTVTMFRARPSAADAALASANVFTTPCVANMSPNVYPIAAISEPAC